MAYLFPRIPSSCIKRCMASYLFPGHYDLVTPDGYIEKIDFLESEHALVEVVIEEISPAFIGYQLDSKQLSFNFKSVLAQLG
ncbi:MAG: hypothetical protein HY324_03600, partial [Chlamydiia bacterium]|nr:hypothetical protein [Chlamydiia bacterium]